MQAMLFAAGLGTRLFPITRDKPKALAPFMKGTLLQYNLEFLAGQGVNHFVINTHHFAERIENYLIENDNFGLNIHISYEPTLLETAGGVAKARDQFDKSESPILLYNVDVISNIQIDRLTKNHLSYKNDVTLAVKNRETSRHLFFDGENRLMAWRNNKTNEVRPGNANLSGLTPYGFSGIQIISPRVLPLFKPGRKYSLIDFYLEQMDAIQIGSSLHDEDLWFDCGKPETLALAEDSMK